MTKINMPTFTKSLISLAFLNPGLFYKAKNPLVFKRFICNTLDLNNLQFDGCGTILCSNYISRASGSVTFDTVKIENLAIRTIVQDSGTTSARSMVNIEGSHRRYNPNNGSMPECAHAGAPRNQETMWQKITQSIDCGIRA
jgi:hypothetical protein